MGASPWWPVPLLTSCALMLVCLPLLPVRRLSSDRVERAVLAQHPRAGASLWAPAKRKQCPACQACPTCEPPPTPAAPDEPPPLAWPPWLEGGWQDKLLPDDAVVRGQTRWGGCGASGEDRMRRFAAKLVAGEPVTIVAIGGSVTAGAGVGNNLQWAYVSRFLSWINSTFPHPQHRLLNQGVAASTTGLYAVCTSAMVNENADLLVIESTLNDNYPLDIDAPQRHAYELLLRRLLTLPGRPLVAVLHHYSWPLASRRPGDVGTRDPGRFGGLYYGTDEGKFNNFAEYYDCPVLSVRAAAHPLMRAGAPGFRADRSWFAPWSLPELPTVPSGDNNTLDYFYFDHVHPSPTGHRALADLLVGLVRRGVWEERARQAQAAARREWDRRRRRQQQEEGAGPEQQQQPAVAELQPEDFRAAVTRQRGWAYGADRPQEPTFSRQKWGWVANETGTWAELSLDTRFNADCSAAAAHALAPAATGPAPAAAPSGAAAGAVGKPGRARRLAAAQAQEQRRQAACDEAVMVKLGFLRSYQGHGRARVQCVANCSCKPTTWDGYWKRQASLQQMHEFSATQSADCRVRISVLPKTSAPDGGRRVKLLFSIVAPRGFLDRPPAEEQVAPTIVDDMEEAARRVEGRPVPLRAAMDFGEAMRLMLRSAIVPAMAGYLFTYYNTKKADERKAQIERVRLLYGPLLACVHATRTAYAAMVRQHSPDGSTEGFRRAVRERPEGPEGEAYRRAWHGCSAGRWMRTVLQPLNEKAADIIVNNVNMLEAARLDPILLQFVAHVSAYKARARGAGRRARARPQAGEVPASGRGRPSAWPSAPSVLLHRHAAEHPVRPPRRAASLQVILRRWEEGAIQEWTPTGRRRSYNLPVFTPAPASPPLRQLLEYVEREFRRIKRKQAELLGERQRGGASSGIDGGPGSSNLLEPTGPPHAKL
eukprot:scaffold9.g3010.t1